MPDEEREKHGGDLRPAGTNGIEVRPKNWLVPGPARRVYTITDAGEAYLDFWAESLEQYQRNMDAFFRLYTGEPARAEQQKDDG